MHKEFNFTNISTQKTTTKYLLFEDANVEFVENIIEKLRFATGKPN